MLAYLYSEGIGSGIRHVDFLPSPHFSPHIWETHFAAADREEEAGEEGEERKRE